MTIVQMHNIPKARVTTPDIIATYVKNSPQIIQALQQLKEEDQRFGNYQFREGDFSATFPEGDDVRNITDMDFYRLEEKVRALTEDPTAKLVPPNGPIHPKELEMCRSRSDGQFYWFWRA